VQSIEHEKATLRDAIRGVLPASDVERRRASAHAVDHLIDSDLWLGSDGPVLAYLARDDELNLDPLFGRLDRSACAPRVDWTARLMTPVIVPTLAADTRPGRAGIREPTESCRAIDPASLEIVLVPGVAFDATGARLGRGGGFYDRFLAGLPPTVATIGVCFETQLVPRVPTETHDHRVGIILTARGLRPAAAPGPPR